MGAPRSMPDEGPHADLGGESRVIRLPGGMRWRATVVARLVSVDIALGRESARLVLSLECLTAARAPRRVSLAGVSSLASVSEEELRELVAPPKGRRAAGRAMRTKG